MSLYGQSDLVIRLWVKKQVSVESDLVSFSSDSLFRTRIFHTLRRQIASCFDIGLLVNPMGRP